MKSCTDPVSAKPVRRKKSNGWGDWGNEMICGLFNWRQGSGTNASDLMGGSTFELRGSNDLGSTHYGHVARDHDGSDGGFSFNPRRRLTDGHQCELHVFWYLCFLLNCSKDFFGENFRSLIDAWHVGIK